MAGHAAEGGHEAERGVHAADVLGAGLVAAEDEVGLTLGGQRLRLVGEEDDLAGGGARAGREPLGQQAPLGDGGLLGRRQEDRTQQLVERLGLHPAQRLFLGDQLLVDHLHRDAHAGEAGALPVAALQHVELLVLDGELDVLHVLVVLLELLADVEQLLVGLREHLAELFDLLRRADAGDDVLALRVHQELAVEHVLAAGRIAREADAGGRVAALVAEHHGLDVDGRPPLHRDVVQAAVEIGAVVAPGLKHRLDGAGELHVGIVGEVHPQALLDHALELDDQLLERLGRQLGVELHAVGLLLVVEDLVERIVILFVLRLEAEHDVAVHGDEAAIAVVGEPLVARLGGQTGGGLVVEPEVQDGVHHAGHRGARARADRDQQRVRRVAELGAHQLLHPRHRAADVGVELLGELLAVGVELGADLGGDGESRGDRQADVGHLGQVRALAAEEVLHLLVALRPSRRRRSKRACRPCRPWLRPAWQPRP